MEFRIGFGIIYQTLATGCWILDTGYWTLELDTGYWTELDTGGTGCWNWTLELELDTGYPDIRYLDTWILRYWTCRVLVMLVMLVMLVTAFL